MKVLLTALLAVFVGAIGPRAAAQDWPVYMGGSYGLAKVEADADTGTTPVDGDTATIDGMRFDDDDQGWSVFVGYDFSRFFAVEVGYADLGRFNPDPWLFYRDVELGVSSLSLTARFRYPVGERLALVGRAGVSKARFEEQGYRFSSVFDQDANLHVSHYPVEKLDNETGYLVGGGLELRVSTRLSTALEYVRHEVEVFGIDTVSLRVLYHF